MQKLLDWVASKTVWILLIPAVIVFGFTVAVPIYFSFQTGDWKLGYDINGAIGDFFGGIMNPVIAFLALLWLKRGVELQQTELGETRQALTDSNKNREISIRIEVLKGKKEIVMAEMEMIRDDINFLSTQRDPNHQRTVQGYCDLLGENISFDIWKRSLDARRTSARDKFQQLAELQDGIEALAAKLRN
ncbi:hypothetical protein [Comamonas sp.]|uniref:hypothetical protein n=1 Tax=Comamonas sp. TaxID=34028 RepID=UPI0012D05F4E|nr:hypothetical protein [Comamonas sp.]MPS93797.1 hypothetical protein [Comamonas sp.]